MASSADKTHHRTDAVVIVLKPFFFERRTRERCCSSHLSNHKVKSIYLEYSQEASYQQYQSKRTLTKDCALFHLKVRNNKEMASCERVMRWCCCCYPARCLNRKSNGTQTETNLEALGTRHSLFSGNTRGQREMCHEKQRGRAASSSLAVNRSA